MPHNSFISSLIFFPALSNAYVPSKRDARQPITDLCMHQKPTLGMKDVAKDHDIFLLDMWGVLHDGTVPYDGVLKCVKELKKAGKELIILSNSSKRQGNSKHMLTRLGFDPQDFSQIITSGDIAHRMLSTDPTLGCQTWPVLTGIQDKKVFVFGSGHQDDVYCESAGWNLSSIEEANLIVARGTFTICDGATTILKTENEEEYYRVLEESLARAATRKLPMFITNPDKVRPDEGFPPMPGAIGDAYAKFLEISDGEKLIKRIGKPFPEVFELALNGRDPMKACMVGDALETDVTGGSCFGINTIWVTQDGVHGPAIAESSSLEEGAGAVLDEFNARKGTYANGRVLRPSIVLPHFRW